MCVSIYIYIYIYKSNCSFVPLFFKRCFNGIILQFYPYELFHNQITYHVIKIISNHKFLAQKYDGETKTTRFKIRGPILQNGKNMEIKTTNKPYIYKKINIFLC